MGLICLETLSQIVLCFKYADNKLNMLTLDFWSRLIKSTCTQFLFISLWAVHFPIWHLPSLTNLKRHSYWCSMTSLLHFDPLHYTLQMLARLFLGEMKYWKHMCSWISIHMCELTQNVHFTSNTCKYVCGQAKSLPSSWMYLSEVLVISNIAFFIALIKMPLVQNLLSCQFYLNRNLRTENRSKFSILG